MKARIKFRKYGALRFIGHLDVMRFFQKVMRRAEIPIAFTGGYSPHMIMSFASPLGIGLTSDGEYFDIELTEAIDSKTAVKRMNEVSIEGIEIISFRKIPDDKKQTGMTILAGQIISSLSEKEHCLLTGKNSFPSLCLNRKFKLSNRRKEAREWLTYVPLSIHGRFVMNRSIFFLQREVRKI